LAMARKQSRLYSQTTPGGTGEPTPQVFAHVAMSGLRLVLLADPCGRPAETKPGLPACLQVDQPQKVNSDPAGPRRRGVCSLARNKPGRDAHRSCACCRGTGGGLQPNPPVESHRSARLTVLRVGPGCDLCRSIACVRSTYGQAKRRQGRDRRALPPATRASGFFSASIAKPLGRVRAGLPERPRQDPPSRGHRVSDDWALSRKGIPSRHGVMFLSVDELRPRPPRSRRDRGRVRTRLANEETSTAFRSSLDLKRAARRPCRRARHKKYPMT